MVYNKNKNLNGNKKKLIFYSFLVLFVILLTLYTLEKNDVINLRNSNSPVQTISDAESINYDPPTDSEANSGDSIKQEIVDEAQSQSLPNAANVIIVDANQYGDNIEVRSFVSNLIKDGTCTITFTKDSVSVVKVVPAYADASTTPCVALTINRSEIADNGTWNVQVLYTNSTESGSAETSMELK